MKVNFAAIYDFFFQIYLFVTFIPKSTMLPQIRHIIVNMFSSILIVTVNTLKTADVLDLWLMSFLSRDTRKNNELKILQKA